MWTCGTDTFQESLFRSTCDKIRTLEPRGGLTIWKLGHCRRARGQ
ncbi:unnamed protein product [Staurois parvus]|uniref:Uncharacterized protein n=1 Tax=Staurois parvus TaxID=386267 RepID=A0ABN9EX02_9NEOB|nr:unnamed protein product [Staurois parvus]